MRSTRFAFAAALIVAFAVRLAAQSLGDVAKKEEERRKQVASSGKVYTNKDLAPVPPSSATLAPAASTDASQARETDKPGDAKTDGTSADGKTSDGKSADKDKADKDKTDKDKESASGKKGQAYWSGRMKAARETIDRDTTLADAMQSRLNALATDFVNRDDPAQRAVIERERQKAAAELDRLKKQIIADRKAVSDLEEEARRAGVPPGWLR